MNSHGTPACRKALQNLNLKECKHAGLLLQRYLKAHKPKERVSGQKMPEEELLEAARAVKASEVYRDAFCRWKEWACKRSVHFTLELATPLAIGLGNASPLEIGLTLHHTYGMPILWRPQANARDTMILINFAHPITEQQRAQIEAMTGSTIERVIDVPAQFDNMQPFEPQVVALLDRVGLTSQEWQTLPILVNLPSLNVIAAVLLAELHGRTGHFPAVIRLRPIPNSTPPQFEVAEILNLQAIRDSARQRR